MLCPEQCYWGNGDFIADPLGRAQQARGPVVPAEFSRHPGHSFEGDGQAEPVINSVLARNRLAGQRFAASLVAPQPVSLGQVIQQVTAGPKLATVLALRQALLTDFDGAGQLSAGDHDAAQSNHRIQFGAFDIHHPGQRHG